MKNKKDNQKKIILLGAPNIGKTTLFNHLTWKNEPVGNFDRLTTNYCCGLTKVNKNVILFDFPGLYSLNVTSDDELVVINFLLTNDDYLIFNVVSAPTIERDLILTLQLVQSGRVNAIAITMDDEKKDYELTNLFFLFHIFKVPIFIVKNRKKRSVSLLNSYLSKNYFENKAKNVIEFDNKIELFLNSINDIKINSIIDNRLFGINFLLNNELIINFLKKNNYYDLFNEKKIEFNITDEEIKKINYEFINKAKEIKNKITKPIDLTSTNKEKAIKQTKKEKIASKFDQLFLNPYFCLPVFAIVLFLVYFLTFSNYAGGWIQVQFAGDYCLGWIQNAINEQINLINPSDPNQIWWANFVSEGILGGIFTVLSFIPWILLMHLFIQILEQTGFLSRVSVIIDRMLINFGISGRSVVNIITGVGCNIPGILMSKNCNSFKEHVISIMIIPFVSCSARIVVFNFIFNSLVGAEYAWLLTTFITFFSILICFLMGICFSNILFRDKSTFFITQIPNWRSLNISLICKRSLIEIYNFVKKVVFVVGIINLIMWILTWTSTSGIITDFENFDLVKNNSILGYISKWISYLFVPIGITPIINNDVDWLLSTSLITGFPAKEIVSSNIELFFGNNNADHLAGFREYINQFNYSFATTSSFLIYFSFYIPCLTTIWTIKKEIGWKYCLVQVGISLLGTYLFSLFTFSFFGMIESLIIDSFSSLSIIKIIGILLIIISSISIIFLYVYRNKFLMKQNFLVNYSSRIYWSLSFVLLVGCIIGSIVLNI